MLLSQPAIGLAANNMQYGFPLKMYLFLRECLALPYNLLRILYYQMVKN
jgi:hypothetical protein